MRPPGVTVRLVRGRLGLCAAPHNLLGDLGKEPLLWGLDFPSIKSGWYHVLGYPFPQLFCDPGVFNTGRDFHAAQGNRQCTGSGARLQGSKTQLLS